MDKQGKVQITKEGFDSLTEELGRLVNEKRPGYVERLSSAREEGDLSENSDYTNAKDELEFLDGKIVELKQVLKNAQIVNHEGKRSDVVIGAKVTLRVNSSQQIYHIVGQWEADPVKRKISYQSPLGKALVGKKKGDCVEIEAPAGKVIYEILAIE